MWVLALEVTTKLTVALLLGWRARRGGIYARSAEAEMMKNFIDHVSLSDGDDDARTASAALAAQKVAGEGTFLILHPAQGICFLGRWPVS